MPSCWTGTLKQGTQGGTLFCSLILYVSPGFIDIVYGTFKTKIEDPQVEHNAFFGYSSKGVINKSLLKNIPKTTEVFPGI